MLSLRAYEVDPWMSHFCTSLPHVVEQPYARVRV